MNAHHDSERAEAASKASDWFVRLQDRNLTSAEKREFLHWLQASRLHVAEMLGVYRVFGLLHGASLEELDFDGGSESNVVQLVPRSDTAARPVQPPAPRQSWKIAAASAALTLATLLAAAVVWLDPTIATQANEWRNLTLADGSFVRIAPNTRLRVELDGKRRFIELSRGEAVFRVTKDPARPFVVGAGAALVRAVGTEFGVARPDDDGRLIVTVVEGTVAVAAPRRSATRRRQDKLSVRVSAGEQVTVSSLWPVAPRRVNAAHELASTYGHLVFEGVPLGEAVAQFNRLDRGQIAVDDPRIAHTVVHGVFNATDVESFAAGIAISAQATVVRDEPGILRLEPAREGRSAAPERPRNEHESAD